MLTVDIYGIIASFDGQSWASEDDSTVELLEAITQPELSLMPMPTSLTANGVFGYVEKAIKPFFAGMKTLILTNNITTEEIEDDRII